MRRLTCDNFITPDHIAQLCYLNAWGVNNLLNLKEMLEKKPRESAGTVFQTALKSGVCCESCMDWALLEWLYEVNGCEGGGIAWEGDLPTVRNLRLADLIHLITCEDAWYEDDLMLNIGLLAQDYARGWFFADIPEECGNASCEA